MRIFVDIDEAAERFEELAIRRLTDVGHASGAEPSVKLFSCCFLWSWSGLHFPSNHQ